MGARKKTPKKTTAKARRKTASKKGPSKKSPAKKSAAMTASRSPDGSPNVSRPPMCDKVMIPPPVAARPRPAQNADGGRFRKKNQAPSPTKTGALFPMNVALAAAVHMTAVL